MMYINKSMDIKNLRKKQWKDKLLFFQKSLKKKNLLLDQKLNIEL